MNWKEIPLCLSNENTRMQSFFIRFAPNTRKRNKKVVKSEDEPKNFHLKMGAAT